MSDSSTAPAGRKELRLGLVCYGGVSLAIYMHGVTKEIHRAVRASVLAELGLDSGEHAHVTDKRHEAILGKNDLLSRGTQSVATQGGVPDWQRRGR